MSRRTHPAWTLAGTAALVIVAAAGACSPGASSGASTASPGGSQRPSATASQVARGSGVVSLEDAGLPTLQPEAIRSRVPTRVIVAELGIDLAVVAPPGVTSSRFPYCGVAEFLPSMSRPGRPGTTFIYAHARDGMFLPILEASRVRAGRAIVGTHVEVFTSDDRRFTYEVVEVRRHVVSLDDAYRETTEQLILQTSEGPHGTPGKTMLLARPIGEASAAPGEAHPAASPVECR